MASVEEYKTLLNIRGDTKPLKADEGKKKRYRKKKTEKRSKNTQKRKLNKKSSKDSRKTKILQKRPAFRLFQ